VCAVVWIERLDGHAAVGGGLAPYDPALPGSDVVEQTGGRGLHGGMTGRGPESANTLGANEHGVYKLPNEEMS
jgi:hypothetical protein